MPRMTCGYADSASASPRKWLSAAEPAPDGVGLGVVDIFDTNGNLIRRFATKRKLNAPWAVVQTPYNFGRDSAKLLIGNFGDGRINVFDPMTGSPERQLTDTSGKPITIDGLWSLTFGGVGLLTASRAQKIESVSGLMNLVMMPMWIFSGVFFSYERFPEMIQPLIKVLPLTALNDALRASILEGTPLVHQWPRLLVMGLWGGISFVLALKWFRWT